MISRIENETEGGTKKSRKVRSNETLTWEEKGNTDVMIHKNPELSILFEVANFFIFTTLLMVV